MSRVERSSRVLYVDQSPESKKAIQFLDDIGVEFTVVEIDNREKDPRQFRTLPVLEYVTRGGYFMTLVGLKEVKGTRRGILSDYKQEVREREMIKRGEIPEWEAAWPL